MTDAFDRVLKSSLCSGCGGCTEITSDISMQMTSAGYLRPVKKRELRPSENEVFNIICPGSTVERQNGAPASHELWGPYFSCVLAWASESAVRYKGSSGGALTAIACYLLESGAVDGIIQTAASSADPMRNTTVVSTKRSEVLAAAGSRYAPSSPLNRISGLLKPNLKYAFIGKPCDVSTLKALEANSFTLRDQIKVHLSFFCAGIPSQLGSDEILRKMGVSERDVTHFQYRGNGWPGRATATVQNGEQRSLSYRESWGGILSKHVQLRCRICPDGTAGSADIVCGDAWDCDAEGNPVLDGESEGKSVLIARSSLGSSILYGAKNAGFIDLDNFEIANVARFQSGQVDRAVYCFARLLGLRMLGRSATTFSGFDLIRKINASNFFEQVRNLMGTARRTLRGDFSE